MNNAIERMLEAYDVEELYNRKNAVKEIMQEIVLCGLSRAGFFKQTAFYGGTALRIFYGLDRFSEDLDFSLKAPDPEFDLQLFFPALKKEVLSFGLNVEISEKQKGKQSDIKSAFVKGNTREHILKFYADEKLAKSINADEVIKIKFEVDTDPPAYANFEYRYRLLPAPYEIALYDLPSLFAGKIHAVLARGWKNRVKGRDLYDYVFYLSKNTAVNLQHLRQRLIHSGNIKAEDEFSLGELKKMLTERFESIDYEQAKQDVEPFISDHAMLDLWGPGFFVGITESLKEN